jgi:hypothetical protein
MLSNYIWTRTLQEVSWNFRRMIILWYIRRNTSKCYSSRTVTASVGPKFCSSRLHTKKSRPVLVTVSWSQEHSHSTSVCTKRLTEVYFFSGKVFAPALDIILPATHHTSFPGHRANGVAMETACQIRGQAARLVKSLRCANLHARLHIKAMSAMSCHGKRLVPLLANVSCSARKRGLYHDAQMRMSAITPPDTSNWFIQRVCLIILSYCHSEDGVSILLSNVCYPPTRLHGVTTHKHSQPSTLQTDGIWLNFICISPHSENAPSLRFLISHCT